MELDKLLTSQEGLDTLMVLVESQKEEMDKKKILEKHPYALTHTAGRWRTAVRTADGAKKEIKRKTKQDLETAIVEFYRKQENEQKRITARTLETVKNDFFAWRSMFVASETVRVDQATYKRYFTGHNIEKMDIKTFNPADLSFMILQMCKQQNLTYRQCVEMKMLLNQVLDFCILKGYVNTNASRAIRWINKNNPAFDNTESQKSPEDEAYLPEEEKRLVEQCWSEYQVTKRSSYLAIPLGFLTGCRIGEMSCIKEEDIDFENHTLTLCRSECQDSSADDNGVMHSHGFTVKNELKKHHKKRVLPLTHEAEDICREILKNNRRNFRSGNWLFVNQNGNRQTGQRIRQMMRVLCNHAGITYKPYHKIRKTYASHLIASNNFSKTEIQVLMGHTDITTTLRYYSQDIERPADKVERIAAALSI